MAVLGRDGTRFPVKDAPRTVGDVAFDAVMLCALCYGLYRMGVYIESTVGLGELGTAVLLGLVTLARVVVLVAVSTLVWVPIGVWIGLNPRVSRLAQPIIQVLARFPANFLFPFVTLLFIRYGVPINLEGTLPMSLGAQRYILFNTIAGAMAIPTDLREAATTLRMPRRLRWRRLYLPAIFPAYVTGGITAAEWCLECIDRG